MNRTLKFRVWDENGERFLENRFNGISFLHNGEWNDVGYFINREGFFDVQQYTGLNYKIGKEIYEGDILKFIKICYIKEYDNLWCRGTPTLVEQPPTIEIRKVVFDVIDEIDDFYSPYVLGWGLKYKNDSGQICSLKNHLDEYTSECLYDGSYWKEKFHDVELIGNIHQTPELLNYE